MANGQTEADALRTEHPKLGIEMAEIDTGPEMGMEAVDCLLTAPSSTTCTERLSVMSIDTVARKRQQEVCFYPYLDDDKTVQWIKKNKGTLQYYSGRVIETALVVSNSVLGCFADWNTGIYLGFVAILL